MMVRLHLRRIRVVRVVEDEIDRLVVEVADTRSVLRCPSCGFKTSKVHETRRVQIQDLALGRPTTLVWLQRRFECENCGVRHTEDHPEFEGKVTRRLGRSIVRDARHLTIRELSRRHGLSWHFVMGLVRSWADRVGRHRRQARCRVLLVDETSLRRRHRYVTVLVDGDTGAVLGMVRHRWCRGVKVVVSDGSEPYRAAIKQHMGHATHVLDRFHVGPLVRPGPRRGAAPHPAP